MTNYDQVLVAIVNKRADFEIAREQHWYRIPVESAQKWVGERWPPNWLAFYQTKVFGDEAFAVKYYSRVFSVDEVSRPQLFPGEPANKKTDRRYYRLTLSPLQKLPKPIVSK